MRVHVDFYLITMNKNPSSDYASGISPKPMPVQLVSPMQERILKLKKEKNAVILVHNYQEREIQEVGDYVGDSLGLSYQAAKTDADVICFCGVHFMAETAKIINPGKRVILPDMDAGCSLSDSCPAEKLAAYKEKHPDMVVVSYINCSAKVKALSDVICTSGNAVDIVSRFRLTKRSCLFRIRTWASGLPTRRAEA